MSHTVVEMEMEQARREGGQYGSARNAEELIRNHIAKLDPEVQAAALRPVNEEATADLDWEEIDAPEGGIIRSAVVRGTTPDTTVISYVWEDGLGIWHKGVQAASEHYVPPVETEAAKLARLGALSDAAFIDAAAVEHAKAREASEEARQEAEAEANAKIEALKEEHAAAMADLHEKLAKAEADAKKPAAKKPASRSTPKKEEGGD